MPLTPALRQFIKKSCYVHHARLCHLQLHDDHYQIHSRRPRTVKLIGPPRKDWIFGVNKELEEAPADAVDFAYQSCTLLFILHAATAQHP